MVIEEDEVRALEDDVLVVVDEVVEDELGLTTLVTTHWHVTGAGCVAIWPVTVPNPAVHGRRGVAMLTLPVEGLLNPGKKAHREDEAKEGKFVSAP